MDYSQKNKIQLINEIEKALSGITYGSVELYVQDRKVTQITVRSIKKTSVEVNISTTNGAAKGFLPPNMQNIINKAQESIKSD